MFPKKHVNNALLFLLFFLVFAFIVKWFIQNNSANFIFFKKEPFQSGSTIMENKMNMNKTKEKNRKRQQEEEEGEEEQEEGFLDWSMYNPPISNGFTPDWWAYNMPQLAYKNALDRIYNPLRYPYRSQAFFEQGWYPNMSLPPQVIGCGGRREPCLGGTQTAITNVPPPIEITERNIAPVNITTRGPQGIPQQLGVLYKIFGSLNEVYPLYGRKKYPNSDNWEYYTMIGPNRDLKVPVITKRKNNNELQTNDVVKIAGNSATFRTTVYQQDFPQYIPYA
jgi:hypothetical protein